MEPEKVPYQLFGGPFATSEIINSILKKEIIIEPYPGDPAHPEEWVSGASVNLALSSEIRIPLNQDELAEWAESKADIPAGMTAIPCLGDIIPDYLPFTKPAIIPGGNIYILRPGEKVIAITIEKLIFQNNICAFIGARSCIARLFVIPEYAPFIKPGVCNRVVLEIKNDGVSPIALLPGSRFCQLMFFRAIGKIEYYDGQYKDQNLIFAGEKAESVGEPIVWIDGLPGFVIVKDKRLERLNRRFPVV